MEWGEVVRWLGFSAGECIASVTFFCRNWCCSFRRSSFPLAWDLSRSFLQSVVMFEFFSVVRIEVSCLDVDFMSRVVILLGQRVETFFNLPLARAHIHVSNVNWARYLGRANCSWYSLVRGSICLVCDAVFKLLNCQVCRISVQNCHPTPMLVLCTSSFEHSCYSPYVLIRCQSLRSSKDRWCSVKTITYTLFQVMTGKPRICWHFSVENPFIFIMTHFKSWFTCHGVGRAVENWGWDRRCQDVFFCFVSAYYQESLTCCQVGYVPGRFYIIRTLESSWCTCRRLGASTSFPLAAPLIYDSRSSKSFAYYCFHIFKSLPYQWRILWWFSVFARLYYSRDVDDSGGGDKCATRIGTRGVISWWILEEAYGASVLRGSEFPDSTPLSRNNVTQAYSSF